jgi:hypothetical protein
MPADGGILPGMAPRVGLWGLAASKPWFHAGEPFASIPPNALWVVSENHSIAPAAFREPLPCSRANSCSRSRFRWHVFVTNSGRLGGLRPTGRD